MTTPPTDTPMASTTDTKTDASTGDWTHRARYAQLTGFKRDILWTLARLEAPGDPPTTHAEPHGLDVKRELEKLYAEEVNHGRLYPNLDDLKAAGLLEKSVLDKRTNAYHLTDRAREMLRAVQAARDGILEEGDEP